MSVKTKIIKKNHNSTGVVNVIGEKRGEITVGVI